MKPQENDREDQSRGARLEEAGRTFPAPPIPPRDRPGQFSLAAVLLTMTTAAVLLVGARLLFASQGDLALRIAAPLLVLGAAYICFRLPFVFTALAQRREYYRALQRHREELARWSEERKASK